MMKKSAVFYGIVVAAALLLIGIAWYFQKLIQGFTNPAVADAFQNASADQKEIMCSTMTTQICDTKKKVSEMPSNLQAEYNKLLTQLTGQMNTMGCAEAKC